MKSLLLYAGGCHFPQLAKGLEALDALGGYWSSISNGTKVSADFYRRSWPMHLAMKPFYHLTPQIWHERAFYGFLPIWQWWVRRQEVPKVDVVHSICAFGTEGIEIADRIGALKVIDCPNSHPLTWIGFWQRECDLWCPGETVPIPRKIIARMNRELEAADLIIVQSNFCKETMILNGLSAEKVAVIPMGVDTSVFSPRKTVPEKPVFVCVGTICLRKGHQYLFRAFELVKKQLPEARLVVVGQYKQDFRMERPKWEGTFERIPTMSHPEVAELLRSSTAFVFPSQEEGIARAQIEALASGLPIVGCHTAGTTTVVDDGVEGFIVPGREPARIAEAMIRIATDRALNEKMGRAAAARAAEGFSWSDYARKVTENYRMAALRKKEAE